MYHQHQVYDSTLSYCQFSTPEQPSTVLWDFFKEDYIILYNMSSVDKNNMDNTWVA